VQENRERLGVGGQDGNFASTSVKSLGHWRQFVSPSPKLSS
jgi:hypothetical protein